MCVLLRKCQIVYMIAQFPFEIYEHYQNCFSRSSFPKVRSPRKHALSFESEKNHLPSNNNRFGKIPLPLKKSSIRAQNNAI